jgi:hypothetical protein
MNEQILAVLQWLQSQFEEELKTKDFKYKTDGRDNIGHLPLHKLQQAARGFKQTLFTSNGLPNIYNTKFLVPSLVLQHIRKHLPDVDIPYTAQLINRRVYASAHQYAAEMMNEFMPQVFIDLYVKAELSPLGLFLAAVLVDDYCEDNPHVSEPMLQIEAERVEGALGAIVSIEHGLPIEPDYIKRCMRWAHVNDQEIKDALREYTQSSYTGIFDQWLLIRRVNVMHAEVLTAIREYLTAINNPHFIDLTAFYTQDPVDMTALHKSVLDSTGYTITADHLTVPKIDIPHITRDAKRDKKIAKKMHRLAFIQFKDLEEDFTKRGKF